MKEFIEPKKKNENLGKTIILGMVIILLNACFGILNNVILHIKINRLSSRKRQLIPSPVNLTCSILDQNFELENLTRVSQAENVGQTVPIVCESCNYYARCI